jgi:hypothetical protein
VQIDRRVPPARGAHQAARPPSPRTPLHDQHPLSARPDVRRKPQGPPEPPPTAACASRGGARPG